MPVRLYGSIAGTNGVSEVTITGEHIEAVRPAPAGAPTSDLIIAPGFFDIQINGYGGCSLSGGDSTPDTLRYMARALRQAGVLFFCPTLTTNSFENLQAAMRAVARARQDAEVAYAAPCIHLEGPYIAREDGPRGAHALQHVRPPDWDEFCRLQEAAEGCIGIVTLGPEQPGVLPFIDRLVGSGVVAAIGHTGANAEQIADAVRAGATLSTHLGNGAHAVLPRHPNYIWEQLAADGLYASIISDGHHLPPAVVKCMVRCKGVGHTILISDALAAAGLPPGVYPGEDAGSDIEILPTGRVQLKGTPYLAGAGMILPQCMERAIRFTGVSLGDAVQMGASNPARLLHLEERLGSVTAGKEASLTLFRWNAETYQIAVEAVVVRGELIRTADMGDALRPIGNKAW